jgi:uncharacterized protein YndB with AHSA1/START domain
MSGDRFVYVTYIRTTTEQLWTALTDPDFTARYWFGVRMESSWEKGAAWSMHHPDGKVTDVGEVLEVEKPRLLVLSWRHQWREELRAEGEVLLALAWDLPPPSTALRAVRRPRCGRRSRWNRKGKW